MEALTQALADAGGRDERPARAVNGPGPAATIYDVSREAGVSIATVSRVLRSSGPVAPATRERVQAAMTALRFVPSRSARSLAEGRHAANGIVFPDLCGPYYADVLMGYEEVAGELDRSVLLLTTRGRTSSEVKVRDLAARVDGMVVLGRSVPDALLAELAQDVPLLLLARPPLDGVHAVGAENVSSAGALAAHLAADGHRRFAFLGDIDASADAAERWTGFRAGLEAAGMAPPQAAIACDFDESAGAAVAASLLGGDQRPDALVCANDEIALGALAAARDMGLSVPDDVAVTGWDDVMAARYAGLTTVRQPMRALGALAARRLDDLVRGSSRGDVRTELPLQEVLATELVVRATCGSHTTRIPTP